LEWARQSESQGLHGALAVLPQAEAQNVQVQQLQAHLLGLPGRQCHTVGVDVLGGGGACCAQCSCCCLQIVQWGEMTIGISQTSQALAEALTTSQACTPPPPHGGPLTHNNSTLVPFHALWWDHHCWADCFISSSPASRKAPWVESCPLTTPQQQQHTRTSPWLGGIMVTAPILSSSQARKPRGSEVRSRNTP
jgi:hypothetical protein